MSDKDIIELAKDKHFSLIDDLKKVPCILFENLRNHDDLSVLKHMNAEIQFIDTITKIIDNINNNGLKSDNISLTLEKK